MKLLSKILLSSLALFFVTKKKKQYLYNGSNSIIYFKPEGTYKDYQNDGAYPVKPGQKSFIPFDGVATVKYKNKVFKISDGVSLKITKNGSIDFDTKTATTIQKAAFYTFINTGRVGWKNIDYFHNQNDNSWDELFQKAKSIFLKK